MKIQMQSKMGMLAGLAVLVSVLALASGTHAEAVPVQRELLALQQVRARWPSSSGPAAPSTGRLAQTPVNCTLTQLTTDDTIGGHDFAGAAQLAASYSTLALTTGSSGAIVPTVPDYFYLDASVGTIYKIDAVPNATDNYNLGIVIYNQNGSFYTPILSDTNSLDNTSASVSFKPTESRRYYVVISQLTPGCKGGYYRLSTTPLTPTVTPTITLTPTPIGGSYLTDTLEGGIGNNTFGTAAAVSVGGTYEDLTFYWNYPTPDVDYYQIWIKSGHTYHAETTVAVGLDTYVDIYNSAQQWVVSNDDKTLSDYGSLAEWDGGSADGWFYVKVTNKDLSDPINKTYTLKITDVTPAEATNTPTPTSTGTPICAQDAFEPNNTWDQKPLVQVGSQYSNLTLWPDDPNQGVYDVDYYLVWGKSEWGRYQVETSGWDTLVIVYGPGGDEIGRNDDKAYNDTGSRVVWKAWSDGWYTILVDRPTGSKAQGGCGKYSFQIIPLDVTPTTIPTTSAGPTPVTGYDAYEPNFDFEHATTIGLGVTYDLNFVPYIPWSGHMEDNDFFKLRVKPGLLVTCESLNLSTGTDTNMILYSESQADACGHRDPIECQGLGGNDDVNTAAGEFRSKMSYFATYEGWLYILVGQGHSIPLSDARSYTYKLLCSVGAQPTATPSPLPEPPTPTRALYPTPLPTPPLYPTAPPPLDTPTTAPLIATSTPTASPTPLPPIVVRSLATPAPPGPPRQTVNVELEVFYDRNENDTYDVGEGVVGLQAQVYDLADGALLMQSFTDGAGQAVFAVAALGSVRVVVSYLGFEAIVPPDGGAALQVRISPRQLPSLIP